jgi:hypothetical protein
MRAIVLSYLLAIIVSGCGPDPKRQIVDSWQVDHDYKLVYDRIRRQLTEGDLAPVSVGGGFGPAYTPFMGGTLGLSSSPSESVSMVRWDIFEDVKIAKIWNSGYFEVVIESTGENATTVSLFCWQPLLNPSTRYSRRYHGYNPGPAMRVDWVEASLGDWNKNPPKCLIRQ